MATGAAGLDPRVTDGGRGGASGGALGSVPERGVGGMGGVMAAGGQRADGTIAVPSAAPSGPCVGKAGKLRGKSTQRTVSAGLARSFVHYAPASLDPNLPAPVVIVAHGFNMTAEQIYGITRYAELAEREHFVVMFPQGQPLPSLGPWNVGNPSCVSTLGLLPLANGDDQTFIDDMIDFAESDQCIDRQHLFVTGFSMGGYLANATGCARSEIRAIAAHSGGSHDLAACASKLKPVLIMHFNGDALIPTACGQQARDQWLELNHCQQGALEMREVKSGRCEYARGCPAGGQVAYCAFDVPAGARTGAFPGHAWSGGSKDGPAGGGEFAILESEDAAELSWKFFKEFAW